MTQTFKYRKMDVNNNTIWQQKLIKEKLSGMKLRTHQASDRNFSSCNRKPNEKGHEQEATQEQQCFVFLLM